MRSLPLLLWLGSAQAGWLDRVVQYRKDNFIKDVQDTLPAIERHAKIEAAPPGFQDSKDWDFDSVMRLLKMLRQSETGRKVHRALRRTMFSSTNRRLYLSYKDTYKYFPSIHKDNYYEDESVEFLFGTTPHTNVLNDNDVIIVSNPVEARLPSTKISVKMLRAILEERAFAARIMPTTTTKEIEWEPMKNSSKMTTPTEANTTDGGNSTDDGQDSANITTVAPANETETEGVDTEGGEKEDAVTEGGEKEGAVTEGGEEGADTESSVTESADTTTPEVSTDPPADERRSNLAPRKSKHRKSHDAVHKYMPAKRKHNQSPRVMRKHSQRQTRPKAEEIMPKVLPWFRN